MALEVVKQILDTEKEGDNIVKTAKAKAQDSVKEAMAQAENIKAAAETEAENLYKKILDRYVKQGEKECEPIKKQSDEKRQSILAVPADVMDEAVKMVIERIVSSNGDS